MSNTRKMNELEELGRVDSEKAYTSKGKKNSICSSTSSHIHALMLNSLQIKFLIFLRIQNFYFF